MSFEPGAIEAKSLVLDADILVRASLGLRQAFAMHRTQILVLGFFAAAWISLVAILVAAPEIFDQTLKLSGDGHRLEDAGFLTALSAFIFILAYGVVWRWRWVFWLILIAFLAGILRVLAAILELAGVTLATGPTWYRAFQGLVGIVQVIIGAVMLAEYRKHGMWGDSRTRPTTRGQR